VKTPSPHTASFSTADRRVRPRDRNRRAAAGDRARPTHLPHSPNTCLRPKGGEPALSRFPAMPVCTDPSATLGCVPPMRGLQGSGRLPTAPAPSAAGSRYGRGEYEVRPRLAPQTCFGVTRILRGSSATTTRPFPCGRIIGTVSCSNSRVWSKGAVGVCSDPASTDSSVFAEAEAGPGHSANGGSYSGWAVRPAARLAAVGRGVRRRLRVPLAVGVAVTAGSLCCFVCRSSVTGSAASTAGSATAGAARSGPAPRSRNRARPPAREPVRWRPDWPRAKTESVPPLPCSTGPD
jgi:hypothetical protein